MAFHVTINGKEREVDAPGDMPLLWVLRNELKMVGTKFGCGIGMCGACTVHLDGQAVRSCQTPVSAVGHAKVTTIEGKRSPATKPPLIAPMTAPRPMDAGSTNASGQPRAASRPAQTLQTENCEPTEMSICRPMITSAMPHATTSVGASRVTSESRGCGW